MLRLNLRAGESTIRFGQPSWSTDLDEPIEDARIPKMLTGARVLLLIHGYNVEDAFDAYARIAEQVDDLYDVVVGVTWPGSHIALGYWLAENRSDKAGALLTQTLCDIPYATLDIEAHSCGCRLALEAVRRGLLVDKLILAAPAVDNETVHYDGRYGSALRTFCDKVMICYSMRDSVPKKAFHLSSRIKHLFALKWSDDCKALGYSGAQDPAQLPLNVSQVNLTDFIGAHSEYKKRAEFYHIWRALKA